MFFSVCRFSGVPWRARPRLCKKKKRVEFFKARKRIKTGKDWERRERLFQQKENTQLKTVFRVTNVKLGKRFKMMIELQESVLVEPKTGFGMDPLTGFEALRFC